MHLFIVFSCSLTKQKYYEKEHGICGSYHQIDSGCSNGWTILWRYCIRDYWNCIIGFSRCFCANQLCEFLPALHHFRIEHLSGENQKLNSKRLSISKRDADNLHPLFFILGSYDWSTFSRWYSTRRI